MWIYFKFLLAAAAVSGVSLTLVWWRQLYTKNAGIVDGWWAYNFGLITLLYALIGDAPFPVRIAISIVTALWSLRLGTYLLKRNMHHEQEDLRYRKLREEYGDRAGLRMWMFFMYQAVSNALLSLPFLIICVDKNAELSPLFIVGLMITIASVVGESIADFQLKKFKEQIGNKRKVCEKGLWYYSRHPNYFFEWLVWIGFSICALNSPNGYVSLLCPLLMYMLLNKVTGIPMLEELAVKSKGQQYIDYQRSTSSFFPWFKK